ncbi:hypothetical protein JRO89_XS10G0134800 [Xanthoceras sorbifolium]|uniref:Protein FAR1-RELATED SEQUENCE n=1 Tax=Xanthoceras sorbifolium TaxID=99658 RepID=A0ABQ8HIJ8_9ROSI|nr:hypothetical protein JRO89_XS10G0134800 [Xanthoceras sorbifolium]
MDEVSLNTEPVGDDDAEDFEFIGDCAMTEYVGQTGIIQNPLPPAVGMEFETYDDVYYFYNCYAKEQGFGVRVSNTWYRKSKEKYRGKLSCSSAGFKKKSEANRPRPETRTGCPAMIKFRLMETKRWRIIEVEVEHNHLISPSSGKFYKSHKHIGLGTKRTLQVDSVEEVRKIRLFRTVIIDAEDNDKYDQALQTNHQLEAMADMDSRNSSYMLKSRCYFEFQLSKLYTNEILRKFENEVEGMYSCLSTRQLNADGPIITYVVKEQVEIDEHRRDLMDFEVFYNASEMEVHCICGLYNFRGYLCRHALSILNQNGLEEIPPQYILSRWRKDIKRTYILDHTCSGIDINNPVHRYGHLYKSIIQVVEEGRNSQDRYKVTLQALDEILNKIHLVDLSTTNVIHES